MAGVDGIEDVPGTVNGMGESLVEVAKHEGSRSYASRILADWGLVD